MTQRNKKLINPKFQLKLVGTFFFLACISALFQVLLLNLSLRELAPRLGESSEAMLLLLDELFRKNLMLAFIGLLPLMLIVGVLVTHRIAGPIYRMEKHLEALARGENPGECRIRKEDEFQELCERLNEAQRALMAARDSAALQAPRKAA
jgi:methyl-accepting chemotaxis protein